MNLFVWLRGGYKVGDRVKCAPCDGRGWKRNVEGNAPPYTLCPVLCRECDGTGSQRLKADAS